MKSLQFGPNGATESYMYEWGHGIATLLSHGIAEGAGSATATRESHVKAHSTVSLLILTDTAITRWCRQPPLFFFFVSRFPSVAAYSSSETDRPLFFLMKLIACHATV
jgi:hypothetical protein